MNIYLRIALVLFFVIGLAGCGQQEPAAPAAPAQATQNTLIPVLAASELVVGTNRFPLGVLKNGTPINEPQATLRLRFYYLDGNDRETVRSETDALYRGQGLPFGIYVAYATFDAPGEWGVEVDLPRDDGTTQTSKLRLTVLEKSAIPTVGSPAVPSKTLTVDDKPDLAQLTSSPNPDPDFYQLSVAEALAAQKPFVLEFSTPGYCQTAVCGPNMLVLGKLKEQFHEQVNFIHVEVYPYPFGEAFAKQQFVPAMKEWGLRTEPWTFLIDGQGIVQARYEGGLTYTELEPALKQLAAGEPITPVP